MTAALRDPATPLGLIAAQAREGDEEARAELRRRLTAFLEFAARKHCLADHEGRETAAVLLALRLEET